jgi:MYXO-CTERM domain-containing protein
MRRLIVLCCGLLLAAPNVAQATLTFHILTPAELPQYLVGYPIPIYVSASAGETVNAANLALQIDGPAGVAPAITGIHLTDPGMIFAAAPSTVVQYGAPSDPPTQTLYESGLVDSGSDVSANGLLAYMLIDTFQIGLFPLHLSITDFGSSELYNSQTGLYDAVLIDGNIMVGPEPSSYVLAAMGLAGLAIAAARRRFARSS